MNDYVYLLWGYESDDKIVVAASTELLTVMVKADTFVKANPHETLRVETFSKGSSISLDTFSAWCRTYRS